MTALGTALVVGEAIVDVVHMGSTQSERPGGSPLNVAVGLRRLGLPTTLHTSLGRDRRGALVRDHLGASGVTLSETSLHEGATSVATADIGPDGSATYRFALTWDPAPAPDIDEVSLVHVGSIAAFLEPGAAVVREAVERWRSTALVSFDPNIRPQLVGDRDRARGIVEELVERADIVKASDEDIAWLYPGLAPDEAAERWRRLGPAVVVVTRGGAGALGLSPSAALEVPASPTDVVDTVGAGDSFMAALLVALSDGGGARRRRALERISPEELEAALRFAARCAAITVTRPGADPPWCAEVSSWDTTTSPYRPAYHFSVPDNWKNDPQRPVFLDGEYLYYYLYNADYVAGGEGTTWRLATTRDHVRFEDHGVAIPKNTNGDCWSGSVVVDEQNTAGYGPGAVIALVTQAPNGRQAQYLWYSTDNGRNFLPGGADPVLPNPGVTDFRDPKVLWDEARRRWVMLNAEGSRVGIYASADLHGWTSVGEFRRSDIGLLECPDLFPIVTADGDERWVLGLSANGKDRGLPATYAYWVGQFDGASFTAEQSEPQWLDHGYDFYGAVTYPHHRPDGDLDLRVRHALGWANFWDYPHNTPTTQAGGYNGDDMIVRDLRLVRGDDGRHYLASEPTAALREYTTHTEVHGDVEVDGTFDLPVRSRAYELSCVLRWDPAAPPENLGFEVVRAPGGGRHVTVGASLDKGSAYVDRRPTHSPAGGKSQTPLDVGAGHLAVRVLVDHTSVEVFLGDGRIVHSHRVYPLAGDDRIRLYSHRGKSVFSRLTVRGLAVSASR